MNKKALSLAVCLAVSYSSASYALGLGEIESSSHLNQPFRAKINLLSTTVADTKRLRVRIASPEVFRRVGIERPAYLNSVIFTPTVEKGKPVIRISSSKPITQPFLNFLIEVSWPNGQLLKEYTVLLDPPVLVQAGTAVANNTVGVRPEPKRQEPVKPQPSASIVKAPQAVDAKPAAAPTKQTIAARKTPAPTRKKSKRSQRTSRYRVVRGDTLSKVAKKLRKRGVRNEQMMMAIFRANPTAFRKRNINNLKAGALLRRPTRAEARQLSYKNARSAIYSQSSQWRSKLAKNTVPQKKIKLSGKTEAKTTPNITNTPPPKPENEPNNPARMEVLGNSSAAVDTKNLSATGTAKISQLERQLIQAKESLATKLNANSELKSRVSELESLLRKKNRLLTLKNEQLAELQAKLGQSNPASSNEGVDIRQQVKSFANSGEGTIVRSNNEPMNGMTPTVDKEPQLAVNENKNDPSIFEQSLNKEPETQPVENKTEASTANDSGIFELFTSPIGMGLGGGSLLILLFSWLLLRRKDKDKEEDDYQAIDFNDSDFESDDVFKDNKKSVDNKPYSDDPFTDLEFDESATNDSFDKNQNASIIDTNDDILQEADVYIVYGLHDQAEVELKKAIEKQPDNLHYHAKLLENYHVSSNLKAFDTQADIFSKLADDSEGNKEALWKEITGWAQELKSQSSLFANGSTSNTLGGVVAGVAAGAVAITAGKAVADEKQEDTNDLFDDLNATSDNVDGIDLKKSPKTDNFDAKDQGLKNNHAMNFNPLDDGSNPDDLSDDDLDLEKFLADTGSDSDVYNKADSDELDNASFDELLADVEAMAGDSSRSNSFDEEQMTELGSEFEDLLDLDLTDLSDDLSIDPNKHDVSNLALELDNKNDLNKILPTGSPYSSTKDDADNLLGDLDDDLAFMDLDGNDDDLKETQISTKLDLARAYLDMGDMEGARNTLEEVMMEGNDDQKKEAEALLSQAG